MAATEGSAKKQTKSKDGVIDDNGKDPSVPSWARPESDEPPPWARQEALKDSSTIELPFYVYLLSSAVAAIAAIGSVFEYVNEKPVFGILNSDSVLYAPLLGFFVFAGLPSSILMAASTESCLDIKVSIPEEGVKKGIQRSQWLRAAILGANDGVLSTTSLMLGVGAAKEDQWLMIMSGLAGALAGACSMAVGEFVSVSTQRDIEQTSINKYHAEAEICKNKDGNNSVFGESIVTDGGGMKLNAGDIVPPRSPLMKVITSDAKDQNFLQEETLPNPYKAAGASAIAFLCGSLFPLLTAMAVSHETVRIVVIVIVSSLALGMFGGAGAYIGGSSVRISAIRVVVGGWIAMAITFGLLKLMYKDHGNE